MPKIGGVLVVPRSHGTRSERSHRTRWSSVLHSGRQYCLKEPRSERKPPLYGDPAPQMKHFSPLHGMDRAIMKFSSPTHTQNAQFPTIFTMLGRYFFHRGTPTTTQCYARAIFLTCTPREHPRRGGHRRNRAHLETQSLAAEPECHGRARPQKSRMQFDWMKFQQRLKTLQFQQSKFIV